MEGPRGEFLSMLWGGGRACAGWGRADVTRAPGGRQSRSRQRVPPRAHALYRQTRSRPSDVNSSPQTIRLSSKPASAGLKPRV